MYVKNTHEKFFRGKEKKDLYDLTILKFGSVGFSYSAHLIFCCFMLNPWLQPIMEDVYCYVCAVSNCCNKADP